MTVHIENTSHPKDSCGWAQGFPKWTSCAVRRFRKKIRPAAKARAASEMILTILSRRSMTDRLRLLDPEKYWLLQIAKRQCLGKRPLGGRLHPSLTGGISIKSRGRRLGGMSDLRSGVAASQSTCCRSAGVSAKANLRSGPPNPDHPDPRTVNVCTILWLRGFKVNQRNSWRKDRHVIQKVERMRVLFVRGRIMSQLVPPEAPGRLAHFRIPDFKFQRLR